MPPSSFSGSRWLLGGLVLVGLAGALVALVYLDAHPIILSPPALSSSPSEAGLSVPKDDAIPWDGLVLLPGAFTLGSSLASLPLAEQESLQGWQRWMLQNAGSARALGLDTLSASRTGHAFLASRRWVAIPAPTDPALTTENREYLMAFVRAGGALLLELPGPSWSSLLPGTLLPDLLSPGRFLPSTALPGGSAELLPRLRLPVRQRLWKQSAAELEPNPSAPDTSEGPLLGAPEVLLQTTSGPALVRMHVGQGVMVLSLLELSRLWARWEQGVLAPSGYLENRHPEQQSVVLETNDLVEDPALLRADYPIADLLEDLVWRTLADPGLIPGLWHFPNAQPGALLLTHDEEAFGDRADWMAQADADQGCPSTQLIVPSPAVSQEGLRGYARLQAEVGLHIVLTGPAGELYPGSGESVEGRFQPYGVWKLNPVWRLLTPLEQNRFLAARMGQDALPTVSRTHFLAWPVQAWGFFSRLAEAGLLLDSSYGPDLKNRGFLFGTGRPFHPADAQGRLLSLLEHPFISAEDLGDASEAWLKARLRESASSTFQAINVLYHPNAFRWHPSVPAWRAWQSLCPEARSLGLWVTTLSALARATLEREDSLVWSVQTADGVEVHWRLKAPGVTLAIPLTADWLTSAWPPGQMREVPLLGAPLTLFAPSALEGWMTFTRRTALPARPERGP